MNLTLTTNVGKIGSIQSTFTIQYCVPFNYQDTDSRFGDSIRRGKNATDSNDRYGYHLNPYITLSTFLDDGGGRSIIFNRSAYYGWIRELNKFIRDYKVSLNEIYFYDEYNALQYHEDIANTISIQFHTGKELLTLFPGIYRDNNNIAQPCIFLSVMSTKEYYAFSFDDMIALHDIMVHNNVDQIAMQLLTMHFAFKNLQ